MSNYMINSNNHMVLAMYLPQYHEIKENNEWWGKGYTDWYAVKNAKNECQYHLQPHKPMDDFYYDLLDVNTLKWQADLMHQYGIDGMCFYHYYFKNGRRILEKPAEMLLEKKNINMPFCFCWANESWVKSWSNISESNVWSYKYEMTNRDENKFLLEQDYGDEKEWIKHFDYLKNFFLDARYIKIDNKPVFFIYKFDLIEMSEQMINCWNNMAKNIGYDGIYIVAGNCQIKENFLVDSYYYHEPLRSKNSVPFIKSDEVPTLIDYDDIWRVILDDKKTKYKTIYGGFVGYDDTPRHEKKGTVIVGQTPYKFEIYLSELIAKNIVNNNSFTVINAWNEWGEGMYLEPNDATKFEYLSAVKNAKMKWVNYTDKYLFRRDTGIHSLIDRSQSMKDVLYWKVLDDWMCLNERKIDICDRFILQGIKSIYIYGMGKLGKHFYSLVNSKIDIKGIIDKQINGDYDGIKVYRKGDELDINATIIVSISYDNEMVINELKTLYPLNNIVDLCSFLQNIRKEEMV